MITQLAAGEPEAVDEYISIVFGNSIYPDVVAAHSDIDFSYNAELRELSITLIFPPPDVIPATKAFRYVRASDEIAETKLPQRDSSVRYAELVNNMTLRTVHEVWSRTEPATSTASPWSAG